MDKDKSSDQPPFSFEGKYKLLDELGTGAFGGVYLANHVHMDKKVAIKMLHPNHASNHEAVQRFQREAQAAAKIDHPNICAATDFGAYKGSYYIVMEYLDGITLYDLESEVGPFDPVRALHIILQVCSALDKAHEVGVVHRDLKPENIVLVDHDDDPDFVKITDFGIAQIDVESENVRLTQAGVVYGSPLYLSPEQATASIIDSRSDLYSVGIILYEMISGKLPFNGESAAAVLAKHVTEKPPLFCDISPDLKCDHELESVIRKLLRKNPEDRIQSAAEVFSILATIKSRIERDGITSRYSNWLRFSYWYRSLPVKKQQVFQGVVIAITILFIVLGVRMTSSWSSDNAEDPAAVSNVDPDLGQQISSDMEGEEDTTPEVDTAPLVASRDAFMQWPNVVALVQALAENPEETLLRFPQLFDGTDPNPIPIDSPLSEAHLRWLYANALVENHQYDEAFDQLEKVVTLAPDYAYESSLVNLVTTSLQSSRAKQYKAAQAFVTKHINRNIGRRLAELAEHDQLLNTRKISLQILEQTGMFKKLPRWNKLTIRLRHARGCENNRQIIVKIGELGDARALGALRRFTAHPMTGCGPSRQEDCWGCLRPELREAVTRLESKP